VQSSSVKGGEIAEVPPVKRGDIMTKWSPIKMGEIVGGIAIREEE